MPTVPKKLYFIRHEHSCANQLEKVCGKDFKYKLGIRGKLMGRGFYQNKRGEYAPDPHLSFFGVKHGLHLNIEYFRQAKSVCHNVEDFFCSQLVRTAETAIVLFSHLSQINLHIIPFISEERREKYGISGQNKDNEPTNPLEYIKKIMLFFSKIKTLENINLGIITFVFYDDEYNPINDMSIISLTYNTQTTTITVNPKKLIRLSNQSEVSEVSELFDGTSQLQKLFDETKFKFNSGPDKEQFKTNFTNNKLIDKSNIIITHSKFLEGLDKRYSQQVFNKNNKNNGVTLLYSMTSDTEGNAKFLNGHMYEYSNNYKFNIRMFENYKFNIVYNDDIDIRLKDTLNQLKPRTLLDISKLGKEYCNLNNPKYENKINELIGLKHSDKQNEQNKHPQVLLPRPTTLTRGGSKNPKKKPPSKKKKSISKRKPKVYTGKRGGQYIIKNKRKVYLSSTQR